MKKKNTKLLPSESLITELAFKLILDSEETEGFEFNLNTVDAGGAEKLINLDKRTVLEFLKDEFTKVAIKVDEEWNTSYLTASNSLSNETIEIRGLSDHYLALIKMVDKSLQTKLALKKDKNTPLLTHDFIKGLNLALQRNKEGEIGIGEYRDLDFLGRPVEVHITTITDDGYELPIRSIQLSHPQTIQQEMDDLLDWVNNKAFKNKKNVLKDAAIFQTRFIKIHPFRDGNGRTARLLTNYLLLTFERPIVSIPIQDKNDYVQALNYANSSSIEMSAQEISPFRAFLSKQYKRLNPFRFNANQQDVVKFMEAYRTDNNRYDFVYNTFRNHQLLISSSKVIENILNNYGQKNLDLHIDVGKIKSNQVDYEKL